jgi:CheY-like chemotaxis protein
MKNHDEYTGLFSALKVLIVDDDRFQIELMREMLQELGVAPGRVQSARSGAEAMRQLGAGRMPDLLICDLYMPGMDGFQFMESLAHSGYPNAVLIVSGQNGAVRHSAGLVAQLQRLHYIGALEKPVGLEALNTILVKVTDSSLCRPGA